MFCCDVALKRATENVWKLSRSVYYLRRLFSQEVLNQSYHDAPENEKQLNPKGPLDGIRICDMSRVLVGPYCTTILGDMGAEVIKVERPGLGDETRGWGPPFLNNESCYFLSNNRNKKGIAVDLKNNAGKEIIYKLVSKSDIFVENFVPGKMSELGFGYEQLSKINPNLIYASISGFGTEGPLRKKPGYDLIASAAGGLLSITGNKDEICRPGIAITDIMTGMFTLNAILQALNEREYTGQGNYISSSLFQTQLAMLSSVGVAVLNTGEEVERGGTSHHAISPCQVFETLDSKLAIAATSNEEFCCLCKAIQHDHLVDDERFSDNSLRVINRSLLSSTIQECLKEKSTSEWVSLFDKHNVPYSTINNMKESFESEQTMSLNMIQELHHKTVGKVRIPGSAINFRDSIHYDTPPPLLGEHTNEILSNVLQYSTSEINQFEMDKVIYIDRT